MQDMRARIDRGDVEAERREAIKVAPFALRGNLQANDFDQAMCDIAADRAAKLSA